MMDFRKFEMQQDFCRIQKFHNTLFLLLIPSKSQYHRGPLLLFWTDTGFPFVTDVENVTIISNKRHNEV